MSTWTSDDEPETVPVSAMGWLRVALRGTALGLVIYGCLAILLITRLIERPLCGLNRPVTPYITQFVCRSALRIMGIRLKTRGTPMRERGAIVANHGSWLDIFTLNAPQRIYFVSKSEVANWPGIGWLAKATGTLFINRDRREAKAQTELFEARLDAGHKLLFFPEGTSSDGLRVLPFKPTLFAAFFSDHLRPYLRIQPVTVIYTAPEGADARFYGWWGDMDFGPHLLQVLASPQQGEVEVVFHEPVKISEFADRKTLAKRCEEVVRSSWPEAR